MPPKNFFFKFLWVITCLFNLYHCILERKKNTPKKSKISMTPSQSMWLSMNSRSVGIVFYGSTFSFQGSPVLFLWKFLLCFHSSSWTHNIWTLFSFQFIMFKTMITLFSFQFTMSKTIFCIKGPNIFTWDPRLSDILTIPIIWSVTTHRNYRIRWTQQSKIPSSKLGQPSNPYNIKQSHSIFVYGQFFSFSMSRVKTT